METGFIFSIQRASFVDGPGIRTTVFFKGCNLKCLWCHNPESQSPKKQLMFFENRCAHCGHCAAICPHGAIRPDFSADARLCQACGLCEAACPNGARELCGKTMTADEVFSEIAADRDYYGAEGGATFSGGECMLHVPFLKELLARCRRAGIQSAVDTAGNVPYSAFEAVEPLTDLFLYDLKAFSPAVHQRLTGANNERILDNYIRLLSRCPNKMVARVPVIPGANDGEMDMVADFLAAHPPKYAELLPYHAMGASKARAIGESPFLAETPSASQMDALRQRFRKKGVNCK